MFSNSRSGEASLLRQRRVFSLIIAVASMAGFASAAHAASSGLPPLMPEQEEISAALEGLPPHLREQAGVFVLRSKGYERVRESRNEFNCVLIREWGKSFESQCYDAEGTATILPIVLLSSQLLAKGTSEAEIDAAVAERYASGELRAPQRVGITYMLSKRNIVVLDRKTKRVGPAPPHLMFYSPYAKPEDFGTNDHYDSHFGIADAGTPRAMIIVPVTLDASEHKHE
jgi:hypothetical protein